MRTTRGLALVIGLAVGLGIPGLAAAFDERIYPRTYADGATRKLGRGIANVLTAPLELIRTPHFVGERDGGFASLTVGMVQGVKNAIIRELAGVVEVATFPIPIPKDFQPIRRPEFVYAHGDWSP